MTATLDLVSRPKKPPTESVRVEKDVAKHARMVAAALDVSLPDYLSNTLRPIVEQQLREVMAGIGLRRKPKPPAE